jgi:hypothetical protein
MTATKRFGFRSRPPTAIHSPPRPHGSAFVRVERGTLLGRNLAPPADFNHQLKFQVRRNEEKIPEFIAGPVDRFELRRLRKFVVRRGHPFQ